MKNIEAYQNSLDLCIVENKRFIQKYLRSTGNLHNTVRKVLSISGSLKTNGYIFDKDKLNMSN